MEREVPDEVTIRFAPARSNEPFIRLIFKHREARNFWCAWKWKHIVDQHFNREALQIGRRLRALKVVTIDSVAHAIYMSRGNTTLGFDVSNFAAQFAYLMNSGKDIKVNRLPAK